MTAEADRREMKLLTNALQALAYLVRNEYPTHKMTLAEVYSTWGDQNHPEGVTALTWYEQWEAAIRTAQKDAPPARDQPPT